MPFATLHRLSAHDLAAMASGVLEDTLTDMDFLETLARRNCFLVPPFVLRSSGTGALNKVAKLVYTIDGKLDKPRILLEVARALRREKRRAWLHRRFSV